MFTLNVEGRELWIESAGKFVDVKSQTLQLEHSLVSISKWESKWERPFVSPEKKTDEQTRDYIKCMTLTQNVDPLIYFAITEKQIQAINEYISRPMSAKKFSKKEGKGTIYSSTPSEDVYAAMVAYQIPFECQKWHFNRLVALIKTCEEKNNPDSKKMSNKEYAKYRSKLNAARRAKYNTRG